MNINWQQEFERITFTYAVPILIKIVGAIALWIIGRIVISIVRGVILRGLNKRKIDVTLSRYIDSALGVLFNILLVLAILSVFGVETTSFAGLIAAGGVAIGLAWSGLLSNFASGVFMVILRPFKVGDMISVAGVTGNVMEIGLFVTQLNTGDNVRTFIGNAKIFADNIQNYTTNPYRRVDLKAALAWGVDPRDAVRRLRERVAKIPNVVADPAPSVEILEVNGDGTVLAVRPFCHNNHYWDVYFATLDAIHDEFSKAGYPAYERRHIVRNAA
jgi:small conductance mechanosensitive channel